MLISLSQTYDARVCGVLCCCLLPPPHGFALRLTGSVVCCELVEIVFVLLVRSQLDLNCDIFCIVIGYVLVLSVAGCISPNCLFISSECKALQLQKHFLSANGARLPPA